MLKMSYTEEDIARDLYVDSMEILCDIFDVEETNETDEVSRVLRNYYD